jgi:hypothetical protein
MLLRCMCCCRSHSTPFCSSPLVHHLRPYTVCHRSTVSVLASRHERQQFGSFGRTPLLAYCFTFCLYCFIDHCIVLFRKLQNRSCFSADFSALAGAKRWPSRIFSYFTPRLISTYRRTSMCARTSNFRQRVVADPEPGPLCGIYQESMGGG